jgi:hypothetical protein
MFAAVMEHGALPVLLSPMNRDKVKEDLHENDFLNETLE